MANTKDGGNRRKPRRPTRPKRDQGARRRAPASKNSRPEKDDAFQWRKVSKTLTFWLIIFVISIWAAQRLSYTEQPEHKIAYSEFLQLMQGQHVQSVLVRGRELRGELSSPQPIPDTEEELFEHFLVALPSEGLTLEMAESWYAKYGVEVMIEPSKIDWWSYLLNMSPWILVAVYFLFILRRMQGAGAKGIFSFGKSRAKLMTENHPKVTFDDVAGADEAKQELQEIIEFLKEPEKFQKLGGKIPKGALLLGPPGTGKTLLAKAIAGEAGVPFFSMSGADFVEMFVGVGASRVRDLFEQGKKNAPCIIFIDEVDAVGRHRGAGLGGGHDEREQTLNQLLVEMDGFDSNEGVILIAATNRPDVLDSALLRPGRFDRRIVVDRPDVRGREGIIKVHARKIPLAKNVDLETLARGTPGFSGADLANMVNEAALLAARNEKKRVENEDLEAAIDKVVMGAERRSLLISENEKKNVAYHEAGHVLVAKFMPQADPVHKVTIIPRGSALGVASFLPDEKHTHSKTYCQALLSIMLGGRVAEELVFNERSSGPGDDIERATELARKMVCDWGMSDKLGPLTFGKKSEEIFLGREIAQHRDYSERTAQMIDDEVKGFVLAAEELARGILSKNLDKLEGIAEALLEKELLDGEEIDRIVFGDGKAPKSKRRARRRPVKKDEETAQKTEEAPIG